MPNFQKLNTTFRGKLNSDAEGKELLNDVEQADGLEVVGGALVDTM